MSLRRRLGVAVGHLRSAYATKAAVPPIDAEEDERSPTIKWTEIRRHNTRNDLWVVVSGRVFDMTEFIKEASGRTPASRVSRSLHATVGQAD